MTNSSFSKIAAYSLTEKRLFTRHWYACGLSDMAIISKLKCLWRLDARRMASDRRMYTRCTCVGGPANLEKAIKATADRHQVGEHYPDARPNLIDDNHIDAPIRHLPTGERNEEGEE